MYHTYVGYGMNEIEQKKPWIFLDPTKIYKQKVSAQGQTSNVNLPMHEKIFLLQNCIPNQLQEVKNHTKILYQVLINVTCLNHKNTSNTNLGLEILVARDDGAFRVIAHSVSAALA